MPSLLRRMFGWLLRLFFPATDSPVTPKPQWSSKPEPAPPITTKPKPVPPPPIPPPQPEWIAPLPPIKGQLRSDDHSYFDDNGRRVPIFCHAGDLILQFVEARTQGDEEKNARVHQAFLDMQRAGYSGLRSWWSICWKEGHPYWKGRSLNPSLVEHRRLIHECLRIGAEDYNLTWHIAHGDGLNIPKAEMDDAWIWMAGVVHKHPDWFALVEGLNEAYGTGQSDPREVERWVNISRLKNPDTLHVLSAAAGANGSENPEELQLWTPDNQRIWYVHGDRAGHWGDQTRHAFSVAYHEPPRRLGWSGEPPGINWGNHQYVSVMERPNDWTNNPWRYAFYLTHVAMCRQVPTYMCSHGVIMEGRFKDAPAFELAPRLIRDLPTDVHTYQHLFHGGERWKDMRIIAAPEHGRADHARADDGRFVITIYPEHQSVSTVDLTVEKPCRGRVHDSVGWTDVMMERGSRWRRDISNGLLFVGEVL